MLRRGASVGFREVLAEFDCPEGGGHRRHVVMEWPDTQARDQTLRVGLELRGPIRLALIALHYEQRSYLQVAFFDTLGNCPMITGNPRLIGSMCRVLRIQCPRGNRDSARERLRTKR